MQKISNLLKTDHFGSKSTTQCSAWDLSAEARKPSTKSQRKSHYNYRDDFALKKFEKVKILVYHIYMKIIFRVYLKNLRKTIFNVLEVNLDENLIFEKKSQNLPPNTKNFDIFKI